jgi:spore germination cell wall hydrolase CwlJ-like protein
VTARPRLRVVLAVISLSLPAAGCSQTTANLADGVASMVKPARSHGYSAQDKECLMRAMFFESNRSSRDGLIAVGTVVMNRLRSGKHGDTICAVVGEKGQFAPGVMTRPMNSKALADVEAAAEAVLKGERHAKVGNSMYFHTAGLKFKYRNMHYTLVAGGNAFYERRNRNGDPVELPPERAPIYTQPVMVAQAEPPPQPAALVAAQPGAPTQAPPASATAEPPPEQPVMVAQLDANDPVLPLAIDGPTPGGRPFGPASVAGVAAETFFPPQPVRPADAASASIPTASLSALPEAQPPLSFNVDQADADAIGALLLASRDRPAQDAY